MNKKSPNFLIIGAARSGTTTLYNCLKKHPLIYLPKNKRPEPHFFLKNKEFKKGYEYYIGKYFFNSSLNQIKGEASTSYLFQKYVPSRIYKYIPNCKFIIMLRNPVERAISNYLFTYNNGIETLDFDKAIRNENKRIKNPKNIFEKEVQPFAYLKRGLYYNQISNYLKYFKRKQFHFIIFDNFILNPNRELKAVLEFLNLNQIRFQNIRRFNKSKIKIKVSKETKKFMINYFKDDINKLSNFLNKDLRMWLN